MASSKGRSVLGMIATNFMNSIKKRPKKGQVVGKDQFGTSYFEVPADPSRGKRRAERYFESETRDKFDQEIPAEWEAWLRGRREEVPTLKEMEHNIQQRQQILAKATELEATDKNTPPQDQGVFKVEKQAFPQYQEYEVEPGKSSKKT